MPLVLCAMQPCLDPRMHEEPLSDINDNHWNSLLVELSSDESALLGLCPLGQLIKGQPSSILSA